MKRTKKSKRATVRAAPVSVAAHGLRSALSSMALLLFFGSVSQMNPPAPRPPCHPWQARFLPSVLPRRSSSGHGRTKTGVAAAPPLKRTAMGVEKAGVLQGAGWWCELNWASHRRRRSHGGVVLRTRLSVHAGPSFERPRRRPASPPSVGGGGSAGAAAALQPARLYPPFSRRSGRGVPLTQIGGSPRSAPRPPPLNRPAAGQCGGLRPPPRLRDPDRYPPFAETPCATCVANCDEPPACGTFCQETTPTHGCFPRKTPQEPPGCFWKVSSPRIQSKASGAFLGPLRTPFFGPEASRGRSRPKIPLRPLFPPTPVQVYT